MTVSYMEVRDSFGEKFPMFDAPGVRDALATYALLRWPSGRRKAVMKEWGLSDDEARSVCSGKCSWATFEKIVFHKRGGWTVLFPIFGAALDQTAEQHIIQVRKAHAEHAERLGALVGDWWPLSRPRPDDPASVDLRETDGRKPVPRRVG